MFDRSVNGKSRHPVPTISLRFFGALVLLALAVLGMEARADDGQSVSTSAAPSPALLQVARSPSSVGHHEDAASVSDLDTFYVARPQDEFQTVSQGVNFHLDISLVLLALTVLGTEARAND